MRALQSHSDLPPPPAHVAIIMDGNGRWAKARGLPRTAGHRRGLDAARRAVKAAMGLGIDYLTLYGFSSENWKRPAAEVDDLMGLLRYYLRSEVAELHEKGVRLRFIGERTRLAHETVKLLEQSEARTRANSRLNLVVALSYGSRDEILAAARSLATAVAAGEITPSRIDEAAFSRALFTAEIPDPDLVIRTSGEQRLSNFLMWQSAYSELVFIDTLWPDFKRQDLESAVEEYHRRERRYGAAVG